MGTIRWLNTSVSVVLFLRRWDFCHSQIFCKPPSVVSSGVLHILSHIMFSDFKSSSVDDLQAAVEIHDAWGIKNFLKPFEPQILQG